VFEKKTCAKELTNTSQGNVAKRLKFGGVFNDHLIANILLNIPVIEF